jgi:hypothetical protein
MMRVEINYKSLKITWIKQLLFQGRVRYKIKIFSMELCLIKISFSHLGLTPFVALKKGGKELIKIQLLKSKNNLIVVKIHD